MSPYLTPPDVAERYQISVQTLYRWLAADPSMPRMKTPSGTLRFALAALERWERDRSEGMRAPLPAAVKSQTSGALATHGAVHALNGTARTAS